MIVSVSIIAIIDAHCIILLSTNIEQINKHCIWYIVYEQIIIIHSAQASKLIIM